MFKFHKFRKKNISNFKDKDESVTETWKSHFFRSDVRIQSHELPQCLDDLEVSVNSGVNSFFPASVLNACVSANIISWGLGVWHALGAFLSACVGLASWAIRVSVWEWVGSSWFDKSVRRKNELDFPVSIGSCEHLDFEVPVSIDVLFLHEDWSSIPHVSRRRSRELIIMTIELNGVSFWGNGPSAQWELFGVIRFPDFNFEDFWIAQTSSSH